MTASFVDLTAAQRTAFGRLAETLEGIDRDAYTAHSRDWRAPIFGSSRARAFV